MKFPPDVQFQQREAAAKWLDVPPQLLSPLTRKRRLRNDSEKTGYKPKVQ